MSTENPPRFNVIIIREEKKQALSAFESLTE